LFELKIFVCEIFKLYGDNILFKLIFIKKEISVIFLIYLSIIFFENKLQKCKNNKLNMT
jgi:hypothetical protein